MTALWFIRQARIAEQPLELVPLPDADEIARGTRGLKALGLERFLRPNNPCSFLMPAGSTRTRSPQVRLQEWDGPAAGRPLCFQTPHEGLLALGPEACLVTLARSWPSARLAMLIDELCGGFSLTPRRDAYAQVGPACDLERIRTLVEACPRSRGIARLRDALGSAGEGAESPFEAQVRTWLCVPLRLGGYACGSPQGNPSLQFQRGGAAARGDAPRGCRIDLYWPDKLFGVECDGAQHDEPQQHDSDNLRDVRLSRLGIREVRISSRAFDMFNTARELGAATRDRVGLPATGPDVSRARTLWNQIVGSEWEHRPLMQPPGQADGGAA